ARDDVLTRARRRPRAEVEGHGIRGVTHVRVLLSEIAGRPSLSVAAGRPASDVGREDAGYVPRALAERTGIGRELEKDGMLSGEIARTAHARDRAAPEDHWSGAEVDRDHQRRDRSM